MTRKTARLRRRGVRQVLIERRRETDQGRAPLIAHGRSSFPLSRDVAAL